MNKLKRTLALMAALAMTATAFVGCGGNESSSSSESKAEALLKKAAKLRVRSLLKKQKSLLLNPQLATPTLMFRLWANRTAP